MSANPRAELRDFILPAAVIAVVGMMIFPLPSSVLDVLLMCNIAFSLALLASAVYLAQPERFTSLPSILLLATLFRLGLNISTTRQLLSSGAAPDVVATFGQFVVSNNLVVGVVVFTMVTLVQFLVIAKGAERVAEVAARFTLDAMPGKQMSIDADIRAGIITLSEAKKKRLSLHRESKLYGALDGAMKFVKGDAIAGLLITLINITAGLIVGVTQQSLSLGEATQKYTIFTVGDGLVSQIPALLVAVSAGIAVTRVGDKDGTFVGRDIFSQLAKEPQALTTAGIVLLGLSLVPGLPTVSFASMAVVFFVCASKRKKNRGKQEEESDFRPKAYRGLLLSLSPRATLVLQNEQILPNAIKALRNNIYEQRGVVVPDIHFEVDSSRSDISAQIMLNGTRMSSLVFDDTSDRESRTWSSTISAELRNVLEHNLFDMMDDTHTRILLDVHQPLAEDLINHVIPEVLSVTALSTILRQLVKEHVSIRHLHLILQALSEFHLREQEGDLLVGASFLGNHNLIKGLKEASAESATLQTRIYEALICVRIALRRMITESVSDDSNKIHAWVLSPNLDQLLAKLAFSGTPIEPRIAKEIVNAIENAKSIQKTTGPVVVITTKYSRTLVSEILNHKSAPIRVLAAEEITEEASIESLGTLETSFCAQEEKEAKPLGNLAVIGRTSAVCA